MKKGFIIAIDGPVASGKGTIAKKLAAQIHAINFNSGGVYRGYALKLLENNISVLDGVHLAEIIKEGDVNIKITDDIGGFKIILDGRDVTDRLATPEISMASSTFSKNREFVELMSKELRRNAKNHIDQGHGIIMEGRQIGTEVYPDADVKIYLTANLKTRATRRFEQYSAKGIEKTMEEVQLETYARDEQDMNREFGALARYPEKLGYDIIDNSDLDEPHTLLAILAILKEKKHMDRQLEQKIEAMSAAGKILGDALDHVLTQIKPGITELEINDLADRYIVEHGGFPGFKKVPGYKHAICACTNDVVVHGIPTERRLELGDVINIDCGVFLDGYHTDMGETIKVGGSIVDTTKATDPTDTFLSVGKKAMWKAIEQAVVGNRIGHISQVIQSEVQGAGYSVVKNLIGHGVGKTLHEKPDIPGLLMGPIEKTPVIKHGMTLAIEVIYNMGSDEVEYEGTDGWTIVTADGAYSAVFERTILVTNDGPILLTQLESDKQTRVV